MTFLHFSICCNGFTVTFPKISSSPMETVTTTTISNITHTSNDINNNSNNNNNTSHKVVVTSSDMIRTTGSGKHSTRPPRHGSQESTSKTVTETKPDVRSQRKAQAEKRRSFDERAWASVNKTKLKSKDRMLISLENIRNGVPQVCDLSYTYSY